MVVLKRLNYRLKSSTLMETLVATVLVIVVFMLASLILNNIFSNSIKNNTQAIEAHLNELQYLQQKGKIELPYYDNFKDWDISVETILENNQEKIEIEATHKNTQKTILKQHFETNK